MGALSRKKILFRPMLYPLSAANCNKMCAETKTPQENSTIDENFKGHLHKSCYPLKATLPRETKIRSRRSDTGGKNTFENRVFAWIRKIKLTGFRKGRTKDRNGNYVSPSGCRANLHTAPATYHLSRCGFEKARRKKITTKTELRQERAEIAKLKRAKIIVLFGDN